MMWCMQPRVNLRSRKKHSTQCCLGNIVVSTVYVVRPEDFILLLPGLQK